MTGVVCEHVKQAHIIFAAEAVSKQRRRVLPPAEHERERGEGEVDYVGKYDRCTPGQGVGRNVRPCTAYRYPEVEIIENKVSKLRA